MNLLLELLLVLGKTKGGFSSDISGFDSVGKILVDLLLSLGTLLIVTAFVTLINLSWSDNLIVWVIEELIPMG